MLNLLGFDRVLGSTYLFNSVYQSSYYDLPKTLCTYIYALSFMILGPQKYNSFKTRIYVPQYLWENLQGSRSDSIIYFYSQIFQCTGW